MYLLSAFIAYMLVGSFMAGKSYYASRLMNGHILACIVVSSLFALFWPVMSVKQFVITVLDFKE